MIRQAAVVREYDENGEYEHVLVNSMPAPEWMQSQKIAKGKVRIMLTRHIYVDIGTETVTLDKEGNKVVTANYE